MRWLCAGRRGFEPRSVFASKRTTFGRILAEVGLSGVLAPWLPLRKRRLLFLAWALVPRRFKLAAYGLVAAWCLPRPDGRRARRGSWTDRAEGEAVGLGAGLEVDELERPVFDPARLADQLVEAMLGDRAVPVPVDVEPVRVARRLPVEQHLTAPPARLSRPLTVDVAGMAPERSRPRRRRTGRRPPIVQSPSSDHWFREGSPRGAKFRACSSLEVRSGQSMHQSSLSFEP